MSIGERIKERRKLLGWSQSRLADEIRARTGASISQPGLKRIEDGGGTSILVQIAETIGVRPQWLSTGQGDVTDTSKSGVGQVADSTDEDDRRRAARRVDDPEPSNVSEGPPLAGRVPVISWVQAGLFCEAVDLFEPGYADEWVEITGRIGPNFYALRVKGDSMEPDFKAGTILVIDPYRDVIPGSFVIAKEGTDCTFKQFVKDGADCFLKPLNERYPMKRFTEGMHICGVVVKMVRDLV